LIALEGDGVSVAGRFDAVRDRRLWQCRQGLAARWRGAGHHVTGTTVPRLTAEAGYPDLTYRGEIATPTVPITSARLRAAGFTFLR
jgi:hypothetical protein